MIIWFRMKVITTKIETIVYLTCAHTVRFVIKDSHIRHHSDSIRISLTSTVGMSTAVIVTSTWFVMVLED